MVTALGADRVVDYTQADFARSGETYDLVYDILGKSSFSRCKDSLSQSGVYLLASFKIGDLLQMLWTRLVGGRRVICALAAESPDSLDLARDLAEAGELKPHIDRRYPMEQAAEAHRYYESGQRKGEVVISI